MKTQRATLLSAVILPFYLAAASSGKAVTVTDCNEASLRSAIATGGTVHFACGGTILVTNPITVTNIVKLDGGNQNLTLSGGTITRIFNVTTGANLTLHNIILREGVSSGGLAVDPYDGIGGAIANTGTVKVIDCIFLANTAVGRNGDGSFPGSPRSSAGKGGAIFNVGELAVTNCVFEGNRATGGDGYVYLGPTVGGDGFGGAILNSGIADIFNSKFLQNSASGGRGGDAPLRISFPVSGAHGGPGAGAAIFNTGVLRISNTWFDENNCRGGMGGNGGGDFHGGGGGAGGSAHGGAVYSIFSELIVTRSTFSRNLASGGAGAPGKTGYGSSVDVSGNGGSGGTGGETSGAAVHVDSCAFSATNTTFFHNLAIAGDGGKGGDGGSCPGLPPRGVGGNGGNGGNGGAVLGAGIHLTASDARIGNCTISSNLGRAGTNGNGGAAGGSCNWYPNGLPGFPGFTGTNHANNLFSESNSVSLHNSILTTSGVGNGCNGSLVDAGYNLTDEADFHFNASTSLVGIDANLSPLANNGGPTLTMAPLNGSPAIDAGDDLTAPAIDQRGVPRAQGARSDIGAVEATFLTIQRLSNGNVRLRYAGIPGTDYALEVTPAFGEAWSDLETKPAGVNGVVDYTDRPAVETERLFRVKSQ